MYSYLWDPYDERKGSQKDLFYLFIYFIPIKKMKMREVENQNREGEDQTFLYCPTFVRIY